MFFFLFDENPAAEFDSEKFFRSSEVFVPYFFSFILVFDGVRFKYYQVVLVIFIFSEHSEVFCSFRCLSFLIFHSKYGTYFNLKSYLYILPVYSYGL